MSNVTIKLSIDEHRLNALNTILLRRNSSIENELLRIVNQMYAELVPKEEQAKINAAITEEETTKRIAVFHLHSSDDDFYFTTTDELDLYGAAFIYYNEIMESLGRFTLDSYACYFVESAPINESIFSVLCNAAGSNEQVSVFKFDFEDNTLQFIHSKDGAANCKTYALQDVEDAMTRTNKMTGPLAESREKTFEQLLEEKELTINEIAVPQL